LFIIFIVMDNADILVIGAGATGLMAAMQLARAGKKVLVIEARERVGGRIHTWHCNDFNQPVELGAEFIHGQLPVTINLLNEANIKYTKAVGDMWRFKENKFEKFEQILPDYDLIIEKLNALTEDITLNEFLDKDFAGEKYRETCEMLRNFAAGYDTADPDRLSAFAMRDELQSEDDQHQYRVEGGSLTMLNYMQREIKKAGGDIRLAEIVNKLIWMPETVTATTTAGVDYKAAKVIITIPLGVLQAGKTGHAAISFFPPIPEREQALQLMGMGAVIKVLLQFDRIFLGKEGFAKRR
jgi:monoamine oxidase